MKKILFVLVPFLLVSVSCKNHLNFSNEGNSIIGRNAKVQQFSVDRGNYIDVTMKNVDAKLMDLSYFNEITSLNYKNNNVKLNLNKNKNTLSIEVLKSENVLYKGSKMECTFEYELKTATSNCIYLCPKTRSGNVCYIDGEAFSFTVLPSFMFCIPLYGFGENRIEVSSIIGNEGILSCQTLWAY